MLDRLRSLRGPGESYSDVILKLAGETHIVLRRIIPPADVGNPRSRRCA